ncbi:rhodanese-like domain-containing protein [Desulfosediminicola sp.]|uniref:rhodanese-like domain-containing protein n=1 Tax=Desulfosediminicola sp. TaxID=2886825 RepID=UPI003AF24393
MDFEAFGTGGFSTPAASLPELIKSNIFLLDLRTREEVESFSLPFAANIPINELPDRLDEIPQDIPVILFSSGPWRSSVGLAYLIAKGFDEVSIIPQGLPEMMKTLKPGPLFGAGVHKQIQPEVAAEQSQAACNCG